MKVVTAASFESDSGYMRPVHLWPPKVHTGQECHQHAADHDEVEVRHDKVGLGQMNVHSQRTEEDSRQAADGE